MSGESIGKHREAVKLSFHTDWTATHEHLLAAPLGLSLGRPGSHQWPANVQRLATNDLDTPSGCSDPDDARLQS